MKHQDNDSILEGLRQVGLTLRDCRKFFMQYPSQTELKYIAQARDRYVSGDGEIEIDDDAEVSIAEVNPNGAYIQAWVWIPR